MFIIIWVCEHSSLFEIHRYKKNNRNEGKIEKEKYRSETYDSKKTDTLRWMQPTQNIIHIYKYGSINRSLYSHSQPFLPEAKFMLHTLCM